MCSKHILEHHAMNKKGGRGAKRNEVRKRIKLATEGTFHSSHPRHPSIE
jgi:hypothetical protein